MDVVTHKSREVSRPWWTKTLYWNLMKTGNWKKEISVTRIAERTLGIPCGGQTGLCLPSERLSFVPERWDQQIKDITHDFKQVITNRSSLTGQLGSQNPPPYYPSLFFLISTCPHLFMCSWSQLPWVAQSKQIHSFLHQKGLVRLAKAS